MRLNEAIQTGERFRRRNSKGIDSWLSIKFGKIFYSLSGLPWVPKAEDINAIDWEVENIIRYYEYFYTINDKPAHMISALPWKEIEKGSNNSRLIESRLYEEFSVGEVND